ncbi:preprotein translocase subunit SecG [Aureispira anguillae]|uniref:Protein-export membrane protein SecG n=1 Tax=Aureispira anguillae TaxID=2864201 RepID=A0A915YFZ2_9BACT|nr:preprotein translocase subunit SecG [Aureispira anguillae]BDS12433.1 preprotein translocase subunit SecG [Aureispira anguillae]
MTLILFGAISLIAIALILVILIQNPKTGTLDAAFNTQQLLGSAQSYKVTEKLTWGLMTLMIALCLVV